MHRFGSLVEVEHRDLPAIVTATARSMRIYFAARPQSKWQRTRVSSGGLWVTLDSIAVL